MKRVLVASVLALSGVYAQSAQVQPPYQAQPPYPAQPYPAQPSYQAPAAPEAAQSYWEKSIPAPAHAFEINGTVSYTQGWSARIEKFGAR